HRGCECLPAFPTRRSSDLYFWLGTKTEPSLLPDLPRERLYQLSHMADLRPELPQVLRENPRGKMASVTHLHPPSARGRRNAYPKIGRAQSELQSREKLVYR